LLALASLKGAGFPVYLFRDSEAGEAAPTQDSVRISSLDGAKGHDFGTVFLVGVVEVSYLRRRFWIHRYSYQKYRRPHGPIATARLFLKKHRNSHRD
jgi:superfamily I DNA/RNA helicase